MLLSYLFEQNEMLSALQKKPKLDIQFGLFYIALTITEIDYSSSNSYSTNTGAWLLKT